MCDLGTAGHHSGTFGDRRVAPRAAPALGEVEVPARAEPVPLRGHVGGVVGVDGGRVCGLEAYTRRLSVRDPSRKEEPLTCMFLYFSSLRVPLEIAGEGVDSSCLNSSKIKT